MTNSIGGQCQADILRLTMSAVEAAELGRWDVVAQCYRERGDLLEAMQSSMRDAGDLLKLDEQVRNRVHIAQAALGSLLNEVVATRQRLHGLRHRLGVAASTPNTVSVEA
ncbi:MAG: hypothetical protein H8K04_11820 [Nitrospira sp.]